MSTPNPFEDILNEIAALKEMMVVSQQSKKEATTGTTQVWASQSQLAVRFGYQSSAEISRLLNKASAAGIKIDMIACGNGSSKYRYRISDVEEYLMNRKVSDQCR